MSESKIKVKAGNEIRYVLPQLISADKDITFSMRVVKPCKEKTIVFRDGERVLKKKSYKALNPAEMIRVDLKAQELKDIKSLEVCIDG